LAITPNLLCMIQIVKMINAFCAVEAFDDSEDVKNVMFEVRRSRISDTRETSAIYSRIMAMLEKIDVATMRGKRFFFV